VLASLVGGLSRAGGTGVAKPQKERSPKIREVCELPEDYFEREFTFTVNICTSSLWMRRGAVDFFIFVQDSEGTQLPYNGFSPDSTVNRIRFILPKEEGRRLIEELSAAHKYEARIRFKIERERDLFNQGWVYIGRISTVELTQPKEKR
jgi:hypothetical protein